jgi:hypothetical protein
MPLMLLPTLSKAFHPQVCQLVSVHSSELSEAGFLDGDAI